MPFSIYLIFDLQLVALQYLTGLIPKLYTTQLPLRLYHNESATVDHAVSCSEDHVYYKNGRRSNSSSIPTGPCVRQSQNVLWTKP